MASDFNEDEQYKFDCVKKLVVKELRSGPAHPIDLIGRICKKYPQYQPINILGALTVLRDAGKITSNALCALVEDGPYDTKNPSNDKR